MGGKPPGFAHVWGNGASVVSWAPMRADAEVSTYIGRSGEIMRKPHDALTRSGLHMDPKQEAAH